MSSASAILRGSPHSHPGIGDLTSGIGRRRPSPTNRRSFYRRTPEWRCASSRWSALRRANASGSAETTRRRRRVFPRSGRPLSLHPPETGRDDQRLPERVCVPRRPGTRFEGDLAAAHSSRIRRLEQRIHPDRPGEPVGRPLRRRSRTVSFDVDFHTCAPFHV